MNQISVTTKPSRDNKKTWYYFEWGKAPDQRRATGIFTYAPAKNQTQRNHNKEAEAILEIKKSQLTIDYQSIGTGYIPSHRFKHNFLDFSRISSSRTPEMVTAIYKGRLASSRLL